VTEPILVERTDEGLELVGDWPATTPIDPQVLGYASASDIRTTIKFQLANGWALYRVTGYDMSGQLVARRIRRGRGKAIS